VFDLVSIVKHQFNIKSDDQGGKESRGGKYKKIEPFCLEDENGVSFLSFRKPIAIC
jgi:hypothetical protein